MASTTTAKRRRLAPNPSSLSSHSSTSSQSSTSSSSTSSSSSPSPSTQSTPTTTNVDIVPSTSCVRTLTKADVVNFVGERCRQLSAQSYQVIIGEHFLCKLKENLPFEWRPYESLVNKRVRRYAISRTSRFLGDLHRAALTVADGKYLRITLKVEHMDRPDPHNFEAISNNLRYLDKAREEILKMKPFNSHQTDAQVIYFADAAVRAIWQKHVLTHKLIHELSPEKWHTEITNFYAKKEKYFDLSALDGVVRVGKINIDQIVAARVAVPKFDLFKEPRRKQREQESEETNEEDNDDNDNLPPLE